MNSPSLARIFLRRFTVALVAVFALTSWGMSFGYGFLERKVDEKVQRVQIETAAVNDGEPVNYLIIGSDSRDIPMTKKQRDEFGTQAEAAGRRSDTLMILHLDPRTRSTLLVSFPRDLWVTVAGHGPAKLNSAFNYGAQTVVDTLKQNFDIPIHYYLEVNFTGFEGIVDAIGTVDLYFPAITRDTFTGLQIPYAGCHQFDGPRALQYVRSRHFEYKNTAAGRWHKDGRADLSRIARQQYFIRSLTATAISKGARSLGTATKLIDRGLGSLTAGPNVQLEQLLAIAVAFKDVNPGDLESATVPSEADRIDGKDILRLQTKQAQSLLARLRERGPKSEISAPKTKVAPRTVTVRVKNGSGVQGVAKTVMNDLAALGFRKDSAGNAVRNDFEITEVRYGTHKGARDQAETLAAYLGGVGRLELDDSIVDGVITVVIGRDFVAVTAPGKKPKPSAPSTATSGPAMPSGPAKPSPTEPAATAVGCPKR